MVTKAKAGCWILDQIIIAFMIRILDLIFNSSSSSNQARRWWGHCFHVHICLIIISSSLLFFSLAFLCQRHSKKWAEHISWSLLSSRMEISHLELQATSPSHVLHSSALQRTFSIFPSHFRHMSIYCHLCLWSLQPAVHPSHLCLSASLICIHHSLPLLPYNSSFCHKVSLIPFLPEDTLSPLLPVSDHISCSCPTMWKHLLTTSGLFLK